MSLFMASTSSALMDSKTFSRTTNAKHSAPVLSTIWSHHASCFSSPVLLLRRVHSSDSTYLAEDYLKGWFDPASGIRRMLLVNGTGQIKRASARVWFVFSEWLLLFNLGIPQPIQLNQPVLIFLESSYQRQYTCREHNKAHSARNGNFPLHNRAH